MSVNTLGSDSTAAVASTTYTGAGDTQPTAGAFVLVHLAIDTGGATPTDNPTSVTYAGKALTLLARGKADPRATRSVLVYGGRVASPTAGQLIVVTPYTMDAGLSYEIIEETAYGGTTDTDGVLTVTYRPTATNGNSETGWMLKLQSESNRLVHFGSAGANNYDLTIGASESGWTRHLNVLSSSLISLGVMSQVGSGDLSPKMDWVGTPASPTVIDVELLITGGASTTYPLTVASRGEAMHGTNGTGATSFTTGNVALTCNIVNGSATLEVTSGIFALDSTFVGATVAHANITPGTTILSVTGDHTITMSAPAITADVTGATVQATGLQVPFVAGRAYLIGIVTRRATTPVAPTSVQTTGGALSFTLVDSQTYATDFNLSVWRLEAASSVTATVVIAYAGSSTVAWQIVEITGQSAGLINASNVAKTTATSATTVAATMGTYLQSYNGVVAFVGSAKVDTPASEGAAVVIPREDKGSTNRFISTLWARNNLASIGANFASASVGIVAVEITGQAPAVGQPSRCRMAAVPHARLGRGGPVRIGG